MLGNVVNGVIGPIFETTWGVLEAQYHEGLTSTQQEQEHLKSKDEIARASADYHQKYLDQHCSIKVLPGLMKEGIPLDKIYTKVKFLDDSNLRCFATLDDLEELYRESGRRQFRFGRDKRRDGLEVAQEEQSLMVLGGPGVGKSTFLRKLGLDALEARFSQSLMPVFIELKSFRSNETTLLQVIASQLEISGFPYSEALVQSMLSEGKMLILLDGLDEVPSQQTNNVIEQIRCFCNQHSQNRFVISCRIAAYKGGFERFTDVTMAEFDDDQIQQFVKRWFGSELDLTAETADKFWELLKHPENASAKELAETPLLLTFLCLVYDRKQSLPAVRSTLYGKALNILLEDWAAEKRIERDPIYQGFHVDLEKVLLSEIAYQSFKIDQFFFSKIEIVDQISNFMSDTLDAPKYLDGAAILDAIEVQQGILVKRASNAYSFSHLTLQEYLTARYISKKGLIHELVISHLTDERWREVFLLVSGLLEERSDQLWLLMEQQSITFIRSPKLSSLMRWAAHLATQSPSISNLLTSIAWLLASANASASAIASDITSDIDSARSSASVMGIARASDIARASAIAIASDRASAIASDIASDIARTRSMGTASAGSTARSSARASDIAIAIASAIDSIRSRDIAIARSSAIASAIDSARSSAIAIARSSASAIDFSASSERLEELQNQIPPTWASPEKWRNFANELLDTYFDTFHLDKALVTFSVEEAKNLEQYLYATKLIFDCKASAVRVSKTKWEAIESRLLTPPPDSAEAVK